LERVLGTCSQIYLQTGLSGREQQWRRPQAIRKSCMGDIERYGASRYAARI